MKIKEYRDWMEACNDRMNTILTAAQAESRDLSAEEEAEYTRLDNSATESRHMLERLNKIEHNRDILNALDTTPVRSFSAPAVHVKPNSGELEFKNVGEFVNILRFNPQDRRVMEIREQSMGVGAEGGILVPTQFKPELFSVDAQGAVIRPRARVLPAGTPPDSEISLPVLNQTAAQNIYGGATVTWIGEGQAKPETDVEFLEVTLKPNEVAAHVVITDKLLRNWPAASATISGLMRQAIIAAEENAFISGNGVGKPVGFLSHPAAIQVSRTTASSIVYADILSMLQRIMIRGGNYIWLASQTTLPQLGNIRDTGNNNLWIQNAAMGAPSSLLGIPLYFMDKSPVLGSAGDLMLVDLGYYLIKDGSGPYIDASPHVYFLNNKTVVKIFWNVDGKPWLTSPIKLEGGAATDTVSPFVILN